MSPKRAFTLIELLVVIAIIAMLLGILMPSLRLAKQKGKMILCSNNQRQVVFGLSIYGSDNSKLPPSASHQNRYSGGLGKYHRPTELNWYMNNTGYNATRNYDFVGKFLGNYLPDVKVFNCALSSITAASVWPPKTSGMPAVGSYGEFYINGYYTPLHSTYLLLWNYQGYNHEESLNVDKSLAHFEAPRNITTSNKLVIQDAFFYLTSNSNIMWPGPQQSWFLPHPFKGASKAMPYYTSKDPGRNAFPDAWLNAGYLDGHVEKFRTSETNHVKNSNANAWLTSVYK